MRGVIKIKSLRFASTLHLSPLAQNEHENDDAKRTSYPLMIWRRVTQVTIAASRVRTIYICGVPARPHATWRLITGGGVDGRAGGGEVGTRGSSASAPPPPPWLFVRTIYSGLKLLSIPNNIIYYM